MPTAGSIRERILMAIAGEDVGDLPTDAGNNIDNLLIRIAKGGASAGMIADAYDATSTYSSGDLRTHDGKLYKANQDISTAEEWDETHWTETDIATELADVVDPSAIADAVGDWLGDHVDPETGYVIDDSLSIADAAADAKKVGDELADVKSALSNVSIGNQLKSGWTIKTYIKADGTRGDSNYNVSSDDFFVPTQGNVSFEIGTAYASIYKVQIAEYASDGTISVAPGTRYTAANIALFLVSHPYSAGKKYKINIQKIDDTQFTGSETTDWNDVIVVRNGLSVSTAVDVIAREEIKLANKTSFNEGKQYYSSDLFQLGAGDTSGLVDSNNRIINTDILQCATKTIIKAVAPTQVRIFLYREDGSYENYTPFANSYTLERGRKYRVEVWPTSGTESVLDEAKIQDYLMNVYMEFEKGDFCYNGTPFLPKPVGYNIDRLPIVTSENIQNGGQGIAVYNNTVFNLTSQMPGTSVAIISLYDLTSGENIAEYEVNSEYVGHGGSAFFSDEFYSAQDDFPLLYVATLEHPGTVTVLRVTTSSATLVRTVVLPESAGYYPQIAHDKDTNYLFTIGYKNEDFQTANNGNKTIIGVFDLNNLTDDGGDTFTPQLVNIWETRFIYCVQSSVYYNGNLLLLSSYAHTVQKTWLYVVNPFTRQIVGILKDFPILISDWEAEGLDVVDDDWIIIGTRPRFFKLYLSK